MRVCAVRVCCVLGLTTLASLTHGHMTHLLHVVPILRARLSDALRVHTDFVLFHSESRRARALSRSIQEVCATSCVPVCFCAGALALCVQSHRLHSRFNSHLSFF